MGFEFGMRGIAQHKGGVDTSSDCAVDASPEAVEGKLQRGMGVSGEFVLHEGVCDVDDRNPGEGPRDERGYRRFGVMRQDNVEAMRSMSHDDGAGQRQVRHGFFKVGPGTCAPRSQPWVDRDSSDAGRRFFAPVAKHFDLAPELREAECLVPGKDLGTLGMREVEGADECTPHGSVAA